MKKVLLALLLPISAFCQQQATLLGQWHDPSLIPAQPYGNIYQDVWGLARNGREYAVIGSTAGSHFIDVTDAANPVQIGFVPGMAQGPAIIHRDFAEYQNYLYIVCDEVPNLSTIQIVDLRYLPDSLPVVYNSNALMAVAHTVTIDTATGKMYCSIARGGGAGGWNDLGVFDLNGHPTAPTLIGYFNDFSGGIAHVHDCFVRNDTAWLNCATSGLVIADFSTNQLVPLAHLTSYQAAGYNHSGWPTEDGRFYYMADENHNYDLKAIDISDYQNITITSLFDADEDTNPFSIPHNPVVRGNYLYVSYYYEGLQVYDISNPAAPQRVYYYDTYPGVAQASYEGAWSVDPFLPSGKILIGDMQTGLYIFAPIDPALAVPHTEAAAVEQVKIFPQPAHGSAIIDLTLCAGSKVEVSVVDAMGQVAHFQQYPWMAPGQQQLNLDLPEGLSSGMYFVQIKTDSGRMVGKVSVY